MPRSRYALLAVLCVVAGLELAYAPASEPFFNGDETRHVMTGVFVRDAIFDGGYTHPKSYAEQYYAQYPCLGLLVWPPGFYLVEGVSMSVFGPSYTVGRVLVGCYSLLAVAFLFRLVKQTHDTPTAIVASLMLGTCRMVFSHSYQVMLEVPTLACALGVVFHLEQYLKLKTNKHLLWLSFWTFATALHRYDAVFLLPLFGIRLALARELKLLITKRVLIAAGVVAMLVAPAYLIAAKEIGGMQSHTATVGTNEKATGFLRLENTWFYPSTVWFQVGYVTAVLAGAGVLLSFSKARRVIFQPYWALTLAVYVTFTPMAELEVRHAIYWVPAAVVFASEAALWPVRRIPNRLGLIIGTALATVMVWECGYWTLKQPDNWVRGYQPVAKYCLENTGDNPVFLVDGLFEGNFIYQVRTQDDTRKAWVIRGDKLLYAVKSDPHAGYVEWANSDKDILARIEEVDPSFIVVEDPYAKYDLPGARKLRQVLANNPDKFEKVNDYPVEWCNQEYLMGVKLVVYRKRHRNPNRPSTLDLKMLWQGRSIQAELPGK